MASNLIHDIKAELHKFVVYLCHIAWDESSMVKMEDLAHLHLHEIELDVIQLN
jgi:hypothetical protein